MLEVKKFNNKELIVRKQVAGFIEKIFGHIGFNLANDRVKQVLYNEDLYSSSDEEKIKCAYDAYIYLLLNAKNVLTNKILNTFFYIYFGNDIDKNISLRLATKFFDLLSYPAIEQAIEFHLCSIDKMDSINNFDKYVISFMFFNYVLVKNNIPTIKFLNSDYVKYDDLKNNNKDKLSYYKFFLDVINKADFQDIKYYKNLRPISISDIYNILLGDKEYIINTFKIKHISLFGSFAKGMARIDSDIDLLVSLSYDLTSDDRKKLINNFKEYYLNKFNRFIDVSEISEYLNDELIKNVTKTKKVF